MSHVADELRAIHFEAMRLVDEHCGVHCSFKEQQEYMQRAEAALTHAAYLLAIRPYMDAKVRLLSMSLPRITAHRDEAGAWRVVSSEPDLTPEAADAMREIDKCIEQVAAPYLRAFPVKR